MQNSLAVAFGLERALAEDRAQISVIVNHAVGDEHIFGAVDRLGAVLGTND